MAVVGLGRLGAPIAACLASRGRSVIGVDTDHAKVAALEQGRAPVAEPELDHLVRQSRACLRATCDLAAAVRQTDAVLVVVPTPSEEGGGFSLRHVLPTVAGIGSALRGSSAPYLVVLTSTVMPGATEGPVRATLEQASGRRVGPSLGLCYSPEFVALGSVVHDFLHPDLLLIGESAPAWGERLAALYLGVVDGAPPVARMTPVSAEVAKLAVNTFVTTKITFANTLAWICAGLEGGDVDAVTGALGLDRLIGGRYLRGAVPYGDPCFPRDNRALAALARTTGAPAELAAATDCVNRSLVARLADEVCALLPPGGTVGVLGLTYKAGTTVNEESPGLRLAAELGDRGLAVTAHDPIAGGAARPAPPDGVRMLLGAEGCVAASDVVVVAMPWPELGEISPAVWARQGRPRVLLDCWRALPHLRRVEGLTYRAVGLGPVPEAAQTAPAGQEATDAVTAGDGEVRSATRGG